MSRLRLIRLDCVRWFNILKKSTAHNGNFVGPMKTIICLAGVLLATIFLGLALPTIVPNCHCGLGSGCQGCGGVIGNTIGSFSLTCFALGSIGFVLILWFGIPIAVLGLIVFRIYKLFSNGKRDRASGALGTQHVAGGETPGTCPNCETVIPLSSLECASCGAVFNEHSTWRVRERHSTSGGVHA
jgi:hypothetical protein